MLLLLLLSLPQLYWLWFLTLSKSSKSKVQLGGRRVYLFLADLEKSWDFSLWDPVGSMGMELHYLTCPGLCIWASLMAHWVMNLPATEERGTQLWSLAWEDPLEKEMATPFQYSHLEIPSTEEPGGLHSIESQGFRHDWAERLSTVFVLSLSQLDKRYLLCSWLDLGLLRWCQW